MRKLLSTIAILLVMLSLVMSPSRVFAIAYPVTPPSVNAVYVYEDLLETGDTGVLIDYYLDYAVLPPTGETATEAYMAVFVDTDLTTQLKSVAPYTFVDSGYRRGLIWMYFTVAETATYSLDSVDWALYRIWLTGNPTLAWAGDPPKTVAFIDDWQTTGDTAVLLTLQVLNYAGVLEGAWTPTVDMLQSTPLGNKLTVAGESYFENVIANLRLMAPNAFAAGTYNPTQESIDYTTGFGAVVVDGVTGNVAGSPVTLIEGGQLVNITGLGDIVFTLSKGTAGTVTDAGGTVDGSPADIMEGTNTIDATGLGNVTVVVNLTNTATIQEDSVIGTGFDLTDAATALGMSRWFFSGLVWLLVTIVICIAAYNARNRNGIPDASGGTGKVVMLIFNLCIIGGGLLGLLHPLVAALMFIAFGALTGYILAYRQASF